MGAGTMQDFPCVTTSTCTASCGIILSVPLWVWAAESFSCLRGQSQSQEVPLHVVREQPVQ